MKKAWKNGTLPLAVCGSILLLMFFFQREINIKNWPFPLALSRVLMIALLALLFLGLFIGFRRYFAWKKSKNADVSQPAQAPVNKITAEGKQAPSPAASFNMANPPQEMLDDVSYIAKTHHIPAGAWHQYDFLLAAQGYGWAYMVSQADYMAAADLANIGTITVAEIANAPEAELIDQYHAHGDRIAEIPALQAEKGVLAIGGMSRVFRGSPVKIVWFNQTKLLRIFTTFDNEDLLLRYAETAIRRTFGTPDAMKLAKPVPGADTPAS